MAKAKAAKQDLSKQQISAPELPYKPADPKRYHPTIGLIACGGITHSHLTAYKAAGYNVVALCDLIKDRAEARRKEFFPDAAVYTDYHDLLNRDDCEVVDIATHPADRVPLIRDALMSGRHVLSQKPFVLDLEMGKRFVDLAEKKGVKLAVNQNGRWSPNWSYMRQAIAKGMIGDVLGAHLSVHWNHNWVKGTKFDEVKHVILYDFAIHWFDILTTFMGGRPAKRVFASFQHSPAQKAKNALLAQALIEYEGAQATLAFDADTMFGDEDRAYIAGTKGTLRSSNYMQKNGAQQVVLHTAKGWASPKLEGAWFPDGFHGTMGELLRSIEEKRQPSNSAANNLNSLALCFAAIAAAETGKAQVPGKVRKLMA